MSSGSEYESGSGGERGFKLKKGKKERKDKDKKEKDKDKKDKKDKDKKDKKDKDKKDKKDKDKHTDVPYGQGGSSTHSGPGYAPTGMGAANEYLAPSPPTAPSVPGNFETHAFTASAVQSVYPPPSYTPSPGYPQAGVDIKQPQFPAAPSNQYPTAPSTTATATAPPSGYRVPLRTDSAFPGPEQTGPPVTYEPDGVSPIFIGSALFETSVQPCKIGPHLQPAVSVPYGGAEYGHHGRYDLLPFVPEQMEWVYTSYGQIPPGRRPIEGGYEENSGKLYHALANINGVMVPGKAGEHLGGANVAFGGREHAVQEYQILCWK